MKKLRPYLLPHTKFDAPIASRAGTAVKLQDTAQWASFQTLLERCNGRSTLEELAAEVRMDLPSLAALLDELEEGGFVWMLGDYSEVPTPVFLREFKRWLPVWVQRMYDQPFWHDLYNGVAGPQTLIGWAIENMHYTRTVMAHMPYAVAHAESSEYEATQFKHLSEEWDHHRMFMEGCVATGQLPEALSRTRPLVTTTAVTHFMRSVAREGALVYNACEALLEATTEESKAVVDFYETAGKRYGLPLEFTDALVRHVKVDEDFEHIDIFDGMLASVPSLPSGTVNFIFNACDRLAELFVLWNTEIHEFYGARDKRPARADAIVDHSSVDTSAQPGGAAVMH